MCRLSDVFSSEGSVLLKFNRKGLFLQDFFDTNISLTVPVTHFRDPLTNHVHLILCIRVSLHARCVYKTQGLALMTAKQHAVSVGVCRDGNVDNEYALVSNAALQRNGGRLDLEAHQSWSVQRLLGEDDPPACLVSDTKHLAQCARLRVLLEYGKRRALLQYSGFWERRQSDHVVIGWNARRECEQLVLQE